MGRFVESISYFLIKINLQKCCQMLSWLQNVSFRKEIKILFGERMFL